MEEEPNTRKTSWWSVKKTEYQWIKTQDAFAQNFAPAWFDFIGRLLVLGALKYLTDHGHNRYVAIMYVLSLVFFFFYLQSVLFNFPFYRFLPEKLLRSSRFAYGFSIVVAGMLLCATYLLLDSAVAAFAVK